jgi:hypothetical protein
MKIIIKNLNFKNETNVQRIYLNCLIDNI